MFCSWLSVVLFVGCCCVVCVGLRVGVLCFDLMVVVCFLLIGACVCDW